MGGQWAAAVRSAGVGWQPGLLGDEWLDVPHQGVAHVWTERDGQVVFRVMWAKEKRSPDHARSLLQYRETVEDAKRDASILLQGGPPLMRRSAPSGARRRARPSKVWDAHVAAR